VSSRDEEEHPSGVGGSHFPARRFGGDEGGLNRKQVHVSVGGCTHVYLELTMRHVFQQSSKTIIK
jgi:hypothetical protein